MSGVWVHPDGRVTTDEGVWLLLNGEAVTPAIRIEEDRDYLFHAVMHTDDGAVGEPLSVRFAMLPKKPLRIIQFLDNGQRVRVGKTNTPPISFAEMDDWGGFPGAVFGP